MRAWRVPEASRLPEALEPHRFELFDTASQSLADGDPKGDTARMYVCGLTPYDATHMGHANTYVTFDLLHRVWLDRGFGVDYVQNVTDVDDPLLERATKTGVDWRRLAEEQTQLFREDMAALNVLSPTHYIGAVEAIPLIADLIKQLREKGAVYAVEDDEFPDLYFDVDTDPNFGSLGHLSEEQARATFAERGGDPDRPGKRNSLDCLVWRMARDGEPSWETTLGTGRPGWHIECTAIALDRLGTAFDVQGGGSDLIFPHHEMCAAEARVASGHDFARLYVHAGMVGLDGEKMSKSKGNLVLVSKLRESGTDPMAIRLALLANRYRDDWSWTSDLLDSATQRLDTWREAVRLDASLNADEVVAQVRAALANDLDAPTAIAAIDAWAGASTAIDGDDTDAPALVARACDALLGIKL